MPTSRSRPTRSPTCRNQEFNPLYERWVPLLERIDQRAAPGQVVFLGDSFIRELDTNAMAERTLNLAIDKETTERLLARIGSYRSVAQARGFVLGVGGSDVAYRSREATLANYRDLLAVLPLSAPVVVLAVLPVDQRIWPDYRNGFIPALNQGLHDLCEARRGCRFIDPTAKLVDEIGQPRRALSRGRLASLGGRPRDPLARRQQRGARGDAAGTAQVSR